MSLEFRVFKSSFCNLSIHIEFSGFGKFIELRESKISELYKLSKLSKLIV